MSTPPLSLTDEHRSSLAPFLPPPSSSSRPSSTAPSYIPAIHLTLTYAASLDSQIALAPATQTLLSGPETKAMTHFLRSRHDGILVGVGTADADDPGLISRYQDSVHPDVAVGLERQPRPVVLDPSGRWRCTADRKLIQHAADGKGKGVLWVVDHGSTSAIDSVRRGTIMRSGGEIVDISGLRHVNGTGINWELLLAALNERSVRSLMVEGGARVIEDLLRRRNQQLVTAVVLTLAPVWLGRGGVTVCPEREHRDGLIGQEEVGRLEGLKWVQMGEDVVMCGRFTK